MSLNQHYKTKSFFCFTLFFICTSLFILQSCKNKNAHLPNVEFLKKKVEIHSFEEPLMRANGKNYREILDSLQKTDGEFYQLFVHQILTLPSQDSSYNIYDTVYKYFITDTYMNRLYDSVKNVFPNKEKITSEIEQAFAYHQYYFPEDTLPEVYTYIAPFVYQVVLGEHVLGIELNMFMGKNFSYYSAFAANLPKYLLYNFEPKNIIVQVMNLMVENKVLSGNPESTLLDEMIAAGKKLYYLDLVLPQVPDSIKIGFTEKQLDWCEENTVEVWKFFAGEELLLSKNIQDKSRYLNDAPNTYQMPEESPGRTAIWVGWQIVKSFMKENKETTIYDLLQMQDGLEILKKSNYDPS